MHHLLLNLRCAIIAHSYANQYNFSHFHPVPVIMNIKHILCIFIVELLSILSFNWCIEAKIASRDRNGGNRLLFGRHNGKIKNNEIKDFFSHFVKEAPKHSPDYEASNLPENIPWLNRNLMERGAASYKRNFMGVSLATLYSGIELFTIKSTSSVLLISGTVATKKAAFTRILRTVQHMIYWCSSGMQLLQPGSPAFNSIQSVRRKHRSAAYIATNRSKEAIKFLEKNKLEKVGTPREMINLAKALKSDLVIVDTKEAPRHLFSWNSTVPVSQFDLGVVSFIIFSHVAMNPKAFGVYAATPEDIKAYVHQAAVMARILGVQDRFNVALNLPPNQYKRFYRNIVVGSLKNVDETVLHIMKVTMEGMSDNFVVPSFLQLNCWLYYALKSSLNEYEGRNILKIMTLNDRICLFLLGVGAGPLNLSTIYSNLGAATFNSWFSKELIKFNATL